MILRQAQDNRGDAMRFDEREFWAVTPDMAPDDIGDGPGAMWVIGFAVAGFAVFGLLVSAAFFAGRWTVGGCGL